MNYKNLIYILKKNLLVILGSLFLVFSWYYEKIDTSEYEDQISEKRRQTLELEIMISYNTLNRGIEAIASILKEHDSNTVSMDRHSALLLNSAASSYTTQMLANHMLGKGNGFYQLDHSYINYLTNLQAQQNINQLGEELFKQNELLNKIDLSSQQTVNKFVEDTTKKINSRRKLYLVFSVLGILMITIDKGRQKIKDDIDERNPPEKKPRKPRKQPH